MTRRRPAWRTAWPPLAVGAMAWLAALLLGRWIVHTPGWSLTELRTVDALNAHGTPWLDGIALGVNALLGPPGQWWVAGGTVGLVLALRRRPAVAARAAVVLGVAWGPTVWLKPLVGRPRPDPALLPRPLIPPPSAWSLPSGHTALAAAVGATLLLSLPLLRRTRCALAAGCALVALVGWSRVYLGVHHPSDVLVSAVVAPVLAICAARVVDAFTTRDPATRSGAVPSEPEEGTVAR